VGERHDVVLPGEPGHSRHRGRREPARDGHRPNQTFIGASFGPATNTDRFAIEVWTKKVNDAIVSPTEWGYLVVPNIQNGRIDGDITVENDALTLGMVGQGVAATTDWGVGPYSTTRCS
jgi:hypothetical protein